MISQAEKKAKQKKNKISSCLTKGEERNGNGNVEKRTQEANPHFPYIQPPSRLGSRSARRPMPSDERRVTLHAAPTGRASACHVDVDTEREEGKKKLASATASEPIPAAITCTIHPSVPTMAMVPRTGSRRGPGLPDISRRGDSMTKRRASPVVHRTHGVPDVAMDGGRIYEGAGQHHDKMRRDREGVKDEGGRRRQGR
jgi:hypothetical protein